MKRLLIVGGSSTVIGGIESFVSNAADALTEVGGWQIDVVPADTAYLTMRDVPRLIRQLSRMVRGRRGADCVWVQYGNMFDLLFVAVARACGSAVMVTPHLGTKWRSQENPVLRRLSTALLRCASRLALISPTQELELQLPTRIPRSSIRNFLPLHVLAHRPAPVDPSRQLVLVHSGRLSPSKGTVRFVEVCNELHRRGVSFTAYITGGAAPDLHDQIEKKVAEGGTAEQVRYLGRLESADLIDTLGRADVLIHLSEVDSYPLIVLEAMALATLPICVDLAGAADMVHRYGGHTVGLQESVRRTVEILRSTDFESIRRESEACAERVRADYSRAASAAALASALDATRVGSSV